MGILALQYQTVPDIPILLALNREEDPERFTLPPRIQSGRPRAVYGVDRKTGGTWAGINQHGLFVAAINAPKRHLPLEPRSRGLLTKELLGCQTAEEALELGEKELQRGCYYGVNFLCVDRASGGAVYGGDVVGVDHLTPGLHILSDHKMDDREDGRQEYVRRLMTLQRIDSSVAFLALASKTFSRRPDPYGRRGIILSEPDLATVSSMLVALATKNQRSVMQYAPGPPDKKGYEDFSALLRQVLSTDRSASGAKSKEKAKEKEKEDELDDSDLE